MAPRRAAARTPSATPVASSPPGRRSTTQAGRTLAPEDAIAQRRTTRGHSQQPSLADRSVGNPRLPEVQLQQSYAYGSSKTPVLPTQLTAHKKMDLQEMAATLDVGVEQAQQHLQRHLQATQANLQQSSRAERARRRASRSSRDDSVESEDDHKDRTNRVAAWASSLDNSQLDDIPEEDSGGVGGGDGSRGVGDGDDDDNDDDSAADVDVDSHKGTDPSSFPSGIFDHSYNYERGRRRPNIHLVRKPSRGDPWLRPAWARLTSTLSHVRDGSARALVAVQDWCLLLLEACATAVRQLPKSGVVQMTVQLLFGLALVGLASLSLCYVYTSHVCDAYTTSSVGALLQQFCGTCTRVPSSSFNFTTSSRDDFAQLSAALGNQMRTIESRLAHKLDVYSHTVDKDMESLRRQHAELSNHLTAVLRSRATAAGDVASPVMAKVNYFAPNNGAMVDPRHTSPTRQKPLALAHRVLLRMVGSTMYETPPPSTALAPWHDVGDCWCAATAPTHQDSLRLGVTVTEMMYPTEVVVENYPIAGSLVPGSTPKHVEVWADFAHLDSRAWESLGVRQMQPATPMGPTYGLIGEFEYDASIEAPHVQAFRMHVNQHQLAYAAQSFVARVVSNYGSDYTCLYRVRMHGVSAVSSHP